MVYITVPQSPAYHQITLEELWSEQDYSWLPISNDPSATHTYVRSYISPALLSRSGIRVDALIAQLTAFNASTEPLREVPRRTLYRSYKIPKRSGNGLRPIDEPLPELMEALRTLKLIFELHFRASHHTSAFAYITKRSTVQNLERHQKNESKWFAKFDLHNFFGSTTMDWTLRMLSMIFPFNMVLQSSDGERELKKALDLCFLNGGLPQGTPISPMLTNILMIPVDHALANRLREPCAEHPHLIYTRYADDFLISSRKGFDYKWVEKEIASVLREFNAPFQLNEEKTRYGSNFGSGANWNLGLMLNQDNKITVGWKNKERFRAMLWSYANDRKKGVAWDVGEIRHLYGNYNYYRMVEKENIDAIVQKLNEKTGVNIPALMRKDMRAG